MKRVANFEKVSYDQYKKDMLASGLLDTTSEEVREKFIENAYAALELPRRATAGSCGHDFFLPFNLTIAPGETVTFPTGIRCQMNEEVMLMLCPRSSFGFKYRLQFDNTLGIIDSDYYYSDNEGHIQCKMTNDTRENKSIHIEQGQAYMQGIFYEYCITDSDNVNVRRNGGFGSTDSKGVEE